VRRVLTPPRNADLALLALDRDVVGVTPVKLPPAEIGNAFQRNAKRRSWVGAPSTSRHRITRTGYANHGHAHNRGVVGSWRTMELGFAGPHQLCAPIPGRAERLQA
jgi:hypothetical protein